MDALTLLALLAASCGSGGNPEAVPAAVTLSLVANPVNVSAGAAATLSWTTSNASSCTASGGWNGAKAVSGSQSTGALSATTAYTLTCEGSGDSTSQSVTVAVSSPPPAPAVTLTANPTTVTSGSSSTLTWSSSNATSCTASGGWSGPKGTTGSQSTGNLSSTTTYALSCTGAGGTVGASRTVTVTSPSGSRFPLQTEAGKRYLIDAQGQPFFMNGDTPWDLIVGPTPGQVDQYLNDRQARGANAVLIELIEFAFSGPSTSSGLTPFSKTGSRWNFDQPHDDYFDYAVSVVDKAAERGMLVLLAPAFMGVPGAGEGWYEQLSDSYNAPKLFAWGQYIGTKFAGRDNILWVHGGDRPGTSAELSLARSIANGIISTDPQGKWLHTFHSVRGDTATQAAGSEPYLSVSNIYTSSSDIPDIAFQEYAATTLPVFLSEARYDENGGDGQFIRQQAYHAILSGAMTGHLIGNDPVWYFGNNWQSYLNSGGARSLPHIASLYASLDWTRLIPDVGNTFLTGGVSSGSSRRVAARADDGSFGVLYTPDNVSPAMTVDLNKLTGPNVLARWYDPSNGATSIVSGSPFTASGNRAFQPTGLNADGARDWVLLLESVP